MSNVIQKCSWTRRAVTKNSQGSLEEDVANDKKGTDVHLSIYEALYKYDAEETTDLSFKSGELLMILNRRDDGWWTAENESGQQGWVPSTYLKKVTDYSNGEVDSSSYSDDNMDTKTAAVKSGKKPPIQVPPITEEVNLGGSAELFHTAALGKFLKDDLSLTLSAHVKPVLSSSGLSVQGLKWDPEKNELLPITAPVQRILTLKSCRGLPVLTDPDLKICSRHVRLCVHDGNKIVSNVYTVRAAKWESRVPKHWYFREKIGPDDPLEEDPEVFIRSDSYSAMIGILFEICYSYQRENSDTIHEVSCGWTFLSLLDSSGLPISSGAKLLEIRAGNPFRASVKMSGFSQRGGSKRYQPTLENRMRQPRLYLRIAMPTQKTNQTLDLLPTALIAPVNILPVLLMHRLHLAKELNANDSAHLPAGVRHSPILVTFSQLLEEPDILQAFQFAWKKVSKNIKKEVKKDPSVNENAFRKLYVETALPLLHLQSLPKYEFANKAVEEKRRREVHRLMELHETEGPIAILCAAEEHEPFTVDDVYFDFAGNS